MAEISLRTITARLNATFAAGGDRKLVFWYDDNAEFVTDITDLQLANAELYMLQEDNQLYTKYFLEVLDPETNYLIYAPFAKPPIEQNHLADMLLYSEEFFTDRISLTMHDLRIPLQFKPVLTQYAKFFRSKERVARFYELQIDDYDQDSIEVGFMSALCKLDVASFEQVLRTVLTSGTLADNQCLAEFAKYDLIPAFWRLCETQYGYQDAEPNLEKLAITLLLTHVAHFARCSLPQAWQKFISPKMGSVIAFLDSLMNSTVYRAAYDALATEIAAKLDLAGTMSQCALEDIYECDTFAVFDELILDWIVERLLCEDTTAKLNGKAISELCRLRQNKHYGDVYAHRYSMLKHALHIMQLLDEPRSAPLDDLIQYYRTVGYQMDLHYRHFYCCYDLLDDKTPFEELRTLIENIYANSFLQNLLPQWNHALQDNSGEWPLPRQTEFYHRFVAPVKERVVVIISDGLRYECAMELLRRLADDEKCTPKMHAMLGVLPSITSLGMAALLPHASIAVSAEQDVLVDGQACASTEQRQAILQRHIPNSVCVSYQDVAAANTAALREIFTNMDVAYVYHNQIDARGDNPATEHQVFAACEQAIEDIYRLILRLTNSANRSRFIVTADHGFIYKRDKLQENEKISYAKISESNIAKRYVLTDDHHKMPGTVSLPAGEIVKETGMKQMLFPAGADIFKARGSGENYVHGGSSPQEMLLPVIVVKTEKGYKETENARITLVSMLSKITNLIVNLDFIQTESVSDTVKPATYKLFFVDANNERISNENMIAADRREEDPQKRIFQRRFTLKNMKYDRTQEYYLVAYDADNDVELFRHSVIMDIAFADDFGFRV